MLRDELPPDYLSVFVRVTPIDREAAVAGRRSVHGKMRSDTFHGDCWDARTTMTPTP
jgi:hypothetical protein